MVHQGEDFRFYILTNKNLKNLSKAAQVVSGSPAKSKEWRRAIYQIEKAIGIVDFDSEPKVKAWLTQNFPEFMKTVVNNTTIKGDGNINNSPNSISQVGNNITELERLRLENLELKQQNTALQHRLNDLTDQLLELTKKILK